MAFNKGLQLNDANTVVRDSISLGGQSLALFQTQLVGGAKQAHGATVFTIRPSDNDDAAGDYQSLLVGQNFAIGIEYNTAGDQYRLVIQSREDFDTGAGTETPAYGAWVATEVETTFGVNLNDNGTLTYMQNGSGAQTLSIPSFTPKTASFAFEETGTIAASDVAHLILDDGRGNIVEVQSTGTATGASGELVTALKAAFDALTTEQQSGFTFGAVTNTDEITLTRTDGAGFTIAAGANHTAAKLEDRDNVGAFPEAAGGQDVSGAPDDLFDRDFDGFVSQIATFNAPLTISELSGYVNQPNTIPETLVNSDGEDAVALLTFAAAENSVKYEVILDDDNGHTLTLNVDADGSATKAEIIAGLKADHTAASDKQGYSIDDSVDDQLKIYRTDGADFSVNSGTSAYTAGNEIVVNGNTLAAGGSAEVYTSKSIVAASMTITEIGNPADDDTAGATYELVFDDGAGNTLTVNDYLPNGSNNAGDGADLFNTGALDANGYAFTTSGTDLVVTRSDGRNFTVKLGANDEAANFQVGSDAIAADSTISSTNGVRSGVTDTISNKVVQNFDFTNLSDAETVDAKATANYAGDDTITIFGLDKTVGPHATTMAALGSANGYDGVTSTGYTGAVAVSSGDKVAADVLFAQIRDVADSGVANRQFTVDVFIDPYRVTDGDFSAVSYNIAWSANLTIDSLTQQDATGGYKLEDIDIAGDSADVRWFKPNAVTDFSAPIATLVFTDTNGSTDPTFTFTSVDIDGTDFTDDSTYTTSFTDTLDADLWDLGDTLVNGNDSTTAAADQLVIVEGAAGGSATAPAPTSGLYLKLDSYDQDAGTDAPDVDYTLGVYSSTATNTVSFEIDLPALADTSVDPDTLVNNTTFTLDSALTDWTVTSAEVQGRTLVVEASGITNLAVGDSIGQISTTITNGFDTTQYFDMVNVQTDADAANENGRGLYVAATRTDADGEWSVDDMPTGIMTRSYVGTADAGANAVTALDAYYALQMSAGLQPNWWGGSFSEGQALAADFDGSGKITAADALAILQYSVGTIPTPDPVQWVFFDTETSGITNANNVDQIAALASNTAVTATNTSLGLGDEVILVGDLSDPSA
jgi:hypothetical protein